MANIKSSKKDIRRIKRRTFINNGFRMKLDKTEKSFNRKPTTKDLSSLYSVLDKMVKKNIIHKNKAAREKHKFEKVLKNK